ncbi:MAG TPA: polysaccharide pyruvyl transferase family protein [Gemmatimonadales bacterium]|nr:polysaccharide pyruvyl transferase family protein [Gemmatimonadales bacterium]
MASRDGTTQFLSRMRGLVLRTLRPLIGDAPRVALVDFPDYTNVGDSLIWLGSLKTLELLGVNAPVYVASQRNYRRDEMARAVGDGVICIQGGGNLGDLWPAHQEFREQVIRDFPANRIIQLPQSVEFSSPQALDRARRVFGAHRDLTILVRTERSFARAEAFGVPTQLCPDLGMAMGVLDRPHAPTHDAVLLARTDHESQGLPLDIVPPWIQRVDWVGKPGGLALRMMDTLHQRPKLWRAVSGSSRHLLFRSAAHRRLQYGMDLLSRGRVVITDRLHGHVLAMLLGVPHCVMDSQFGKVRALWDTWTHEAADAVWCDTLGEAIERAREIVGRQPSGAERRTPRVERRELGV